MATTIGMVSILTLMGLDSAFIVSQIALRGTEPKCTYNTHA